MSIQDHPNEDISPFLIGMMVCCFLYGITCAQSAFYYRTYASDIWPLKYLVGLCLVLDTLHMALVSETLHHWYIPCKMPENYGDLGLLRRTLGASVCITYVLTSTVQGFYILRIWTLSNNNRWIVWTASLFSVVQLTSGAVFITAGMINGHLSSVYDRISVVSGTIELVSTTICDIIISASLVYFLDKSRTGFYGTENLINRLILYSVNVGFFISVIALCNLIFWLALPSKFIFVVFHIIISKFYVNSMFVTLNSRKAFREQLHLSCMGDRMSTEFHGMPSSGEDIGLSPLEYKRSSDKHL